MGKIRLGKTGITAEKNAFGALPVQRVDKAAAVRLLRRAREGGMNYFDTARYYTDSEEKLGAAFEGMRDEVVIATKTGSASPEAFWEDLHTSLRLLRTDHIDVYQFHNPSYVPEPGDGTDMYECMLEAKKQGKILHIGFTNHKLGLARRCIESGLYETLQFPFSYLASPEDIEVVRACEAADMGFVAMKALSGGLITDSRAAAAFMNGYGGVLPIWGIQREKELDEFLSYISAPPVMDAETEKFIIKEKESLSGDFCRGCGYCMPCPMGIEINTCARMSLLLRRSPSEGWLGERGQAMMSRISKCISCGKCRSKCPYGLNTPELLKKNYEDYKKVLAGEISV
ncbi:MAG: aldo/keto reductase [Oscillospiraceae bacterium]|jgi:predicted aldo/keto reductase-like oxidoreductase|nr:aldo/keto reductase [Oscillospiraceae bacterium]